MSGAIGGTAQQKQRVKSVRAGRGAGAQWWENVLNINFYLKTPTQIQLGLKLDCLFSHR